MKREVKVEIMTELMRQLDEQVNVDAGVQYRNPTSAYTCPDIAKKEWETFFRKHPQLIGLSGDLPEEPEEEPEDFEMSVIAMGAEGAGEGAPSFESLMMGESRTATAPDAEIELKTIEEGADDAAGGPKDGDTEAT